MKVHLLKDLVLIRPIDPNAEQVTESGFILMEKESKERPMRGEVIGVGPGKRDAAGKLIPLTVKVGDQVLFSKYGPVEIEVDEEQLLIMSESDILALTKQRYDYTTKRTT